MASLNVTLKVRTTVLVEDEVVLVEVAPDSPKGSTIMVVSDDWIGPTDPDGWKDDV